MIEIDGLEFHYPGNDFRLAIPELTVNRGTTVAIVGPSGSGKTTLLNLIAGVMLPDAGRISCVETEVSSLSEAARREFRLRQIGLVFQEFELLEHLRVLDNILLPCRISSSIRLTQSHRDRAVKLAVEMGLKDKLRRYVRQLSQGERQRVALCRALQLEPQLLLCDEPTGNLDPANKERVLDILFDYVQRHDTTMVTVTHDHQLLYRFDTTIDFAEFQQVGLANE